MVYSFGGFRFESAKKRLTRDGDPVSLTEHQADVLVQLLSRPGEIVSKDALIAAAWQGVAVTDNSLEQAVSALRKALADSGAPRMIETVPRRGYRFSADVTRSESRTSDSELAAMLEPYRVFLEGRAALETLERDKVQRAITTFDDVLARAPEYVSAHLGLANACVMIFETTRADEQPDREALVRAGHHAREACRLDAKSGDAWAALALVLHHSRLGVQAMAAARRAVMLEPDNWRHHLRLAYVAWGEERLRAAHRTLTFFPGFALAHWLAATVYVARQAHDLAEEELRAGTEAQDAQQGGAFGSVGCHWLLGLVHLARGSKSAALDELQRELAFEATGHLFARECAANTWHAIGSLHLRQGEREHAATAFANALERVAGHALAMIGLSVSRDDARQRQSLHAAVHRRHAALMSAGAVVDAAIVRAALAVATGGVDEAASAVDEALAAAHGGSFGWILPVEPFLNVPAHEPAFAHALARLRARAG